LPGVTGISPYQLYSFKFGKKTEYKTGAIAVLDICSMYDDSQEHSHRIDNDMTFSAIYFFPCIISPEPPFSVVFTL
jgi:hypothetical protein